MNLQNLKRNNKKAYRRKRISLMILKVVSCTVNRASLTVFRSYKEIYAQLIDDAAGNTLASASSRVKGFTDKKVNKTEQAKMVGQLIAERANEAGIKEAVFDRNGYLYHGRVKALAESARENGLKI